MLNADDLSAWTLQIFYELINRSTKVPRSRAHIKHFGPFVELRKHPLEAVSMHMWGTDGGLIPNRLWAVLIWKLFLRIKISSVDIDHCLSYSVGFYDVQSF